MSRRLKLRTALAGTLAIAAAAIAPASASAVETVTIGSGLNHSYQGGVCNNNCLSVQVQQVGGQLPHPLLSPVNGVVTQWKVRTGDPDALYHLRIMTPGAGPSYIVTNSVTAPSAVPAGVVDSILTYPGLSAPITANQAIGVLQTNGGGAGADVGLPQHTTNGVTSNIIANNFNGNFNDGLGALFIPDAQHELLLQATVEFCRVPNLRGQRAAAAKSALAAAGCASSVTKKPRRKKRKRGKVLKQRTQPGETVAPNTTVELVVGKKPKKKKKKKK